MSLLWIGFGGGLSLTLLTLTICFVCGVVCAGDEPIGAVIRMEVNTICLTMRIPADSIPSFKRKPRRRMSAEVSFSFFIGVGQNSPLASGNRFWAIFDQLRAELGYADYLRALQRYRLGDMDDSAPFNA